MAVLNVNGKALNHNADPRTPLLWVLREQLGLTGTKYGCGIAQCGACTVHIDGVATRSCQMPVSAGRAPRRSSPSKASPTNGKLTRCRQAWVALDVPQCGYCQSGMIMAADRAARRQAQADRRRHRRGDDQHLPLRHLPAGPRRDPRRRGQGLRGGRIMTIQTPRSAAAAASWPAAPPSPAASRSASPFPSARGARRRGAPEINAWVVIKPDDKVVIRIARSEMGQGTLTGLAQLVAEELECDWAKVTDRISDARARTCSATASGRTSRPAAAAASANSNEYVREGGADGARDADRGGGRRVEGAGGRMQRGQQRHHATARARR